jgi:hypothetical protein
VLCLNLTRKCTNRIHKRCYVLSGCRCNPGEVFDLAQDPSDVLDALDHSFFVVRVSQIRRGHNSGIQGVCDAHSAARGCSCTKILGNGHARWLCISIGAGRCEGCVLWVLPSTRDCHWICRTIPSDPLICCQNIGPRFGAACVRIPVRFAVQHVSSG